jgi:PAS domain S-box-containing protein
VVSTIIPLLNVEGKPRQYISIRHEITERKLAEEALARSETLYRTIVSTLAEGVLIQDRSARITTCNTSAERILGLTHNQIMGSTSLDLAWRCIHEDGSPFPGDTHPAMVALQTGQTQRNVIMGVYKPDDTLGWISINCEPLHREDETEPYGVVTSFTDITARKLTEEALRERDRLRIALDSEHELNAIKNRIMRTISHEFRTPLTVLNVASFRMTSHLDALTPEFIERQMGVIKNQVGRLTAMIEEISNVVRETFDAVGFQPQMTNLNLLAEFNLKDIESTIGASHQLIYRPDPQLDRVMVDERLMNRILINLLSNAVKYSRKDTAITLELRAEDNDAVIVISDQGIGIPPKAQEHLFEPFFRAENVGAINGTGMGLNIVRDCVKLHRGTIEVQSELNRGTEFTVRVPVRA